MWWRSSRGRTASSRCTASCGLAPASPLLKARQPPRSNYVMEALLQTQLNTVKSLAPYSIYLSPVRISHLWSINYLNSCIDHLLCIGLQGTLVAGVCLSQGSASGSLAGRVDSTTLVMLDTWREDDLGLTAATTTTATVTNSASPETENTSSSKRKAPALDDHVSIS
ncbi:unnamed protein product, partial [Musa acuminata subsp. burmannicoides]